MENNGKKIDINCYLKGVLALYYENSSLVQMAFWCDEIDIIVRRLRFSFRRIIKPERKLNMNRLGFETPKEYATSMKIISQMMNTVVPNTEGIYFKNVIFDILDVWYRNVFNKIYRKKWYKKIMFLERCYQIKAAYTIYELKKTLQDQNMDLLTAQEAFDIGMAYGSAFSVLDYGQKFSVDSNYDYYHKITQGLKKSRSIFDDCNAYKVAKETAIIKWKQGDPCDHLEMVEYLLNKEEFSHLKKNILTKIIVKVAAAHNKARGRKGFKKEND